eukprot:5080495-Alexandrium_andersonii.AAC.1
MPHPAFRQSISGTTQVGQLNVTPLTRQAASFAYADADADPYAGAYAGAYADTPRMNQKQGV